MHPVPVSVNPLFFDVSKYHAPGQDYLTQEQELELFRLTREGSAKEAEQATDKLFKSLFDLVVRIAKGRFTETLLPLEDMIQEGSLGLLKAIEKFDPAQECRLSTYASYWISSFISRANVNKGRVVRLPSQVCEEMYLLKKAEDNLECSLGRSPSPEETAQELGVTPARVSRLQRHRLTATSLDKPVDADGEQTLLDFLGDENESLPHEEVDKIFRQERIAQLFSCLSAVEKYIIRARFGMNEAQETQTLGEIGEYLGVSRERVRQVEGKALRLLRNRLGSWRRGITELN